jgi:hypothetical protein
MKKFFFFALALVSGLTMMAQQTPDQLIKLNSESYNFGKIKQNVPVTTYFEVKNISNQPVVLESVTASCGCTTPEWSKEPIAAGATAKIKVGYNAATLNTFNKAITIKLAGVEQTKMAMINGEVLDEAAFNSYVSSDEYKKLKDAEAKAAAKEADTKTTAKDKKKDGKEKKKEKTSSKK